MIYLSGKAHSWYLPLYEDAIKNGIQVPCRQGISLELDRPLHVELPTAKNPLDALCSSITQRRDPINQRLGFSIAHGIQKFLGLPESYLQNKYEILKKYIKTDEEPDSSQIDFYIREALPSHFADNKPWIKNNFSENKNLCVIDQLHFALALLTNLSGEGTRRAYIDFNEGYKPRCISSWHFIIRDNYLHMFQNVRSNDLLVGLPNDLIAARIAQIIMSKLTNKTIGKLHHYSSLVQIYTPDCAGVNGLMEFSKIKQFNEFDSVVNELCFKSKIFESLINTLDISCENTPNAVDRLNSVRINLKKLLAEYIEEEISICDF